MNNRRKSQTFFLLLFSSIFLFLAMTSRTLFAQVDPEETAVPYPIATELPVDGSGYPAGVQPPTLTPANPTPYPIFTATPLATISTLPVVGEEDPAAYITPLAPATPTPALSTGEMIQSNLVLWVGFLIGLFILGTGIYGAIILYTRK